jgi:hypothetical protein
VFVLEEKMKESCGRTVTVLVRRRRRRRRRRKSPLP